MAEIDLDDEEWLLELFADVLDVDPEDMTISEVSGRWMGYDNVSAKRIETSDGDEIVVFRNVENARQAALDYVKDTLKSEPDIIDSSFLEKHIDQDKLRAWVEAASAELAENDVNEMDSDTFWEEAVRWEIEIPEIKYNKAGKELSRKKPSEKLRKALIKAMVEQRAQDPMEFFRDLYGDTHAGKHAMDAVGIDIDAAAEDAVSTDGIGHFLSPWDGTLYRLPNGIVYVYHNKAGEKKLKLPPEHLMPL